MKKSYSVQAWEDETHPAQFHIENVKEFETAQVIYENDFIRRKDNEIF